MKLKDVFFEAFTAISGNKSRTALTLLGLVIGIGSVITVVSIGEGSKTVISDMLGSYGASSLIIMPNSGAIADSQGRYDYEEITREDIQMLNSQATAVKAVTPEVQMGFNVSFNQIKLKIRLMGTLENYLDAKGVSLGRGRFLSQEDDLYMRKVAVIGAGVARDLFGEINPVGQYLQSDFSELQIIGVLQEEEQSVISMMSGYDDSNNNSVFIPVSTIERLGGSSYIYFLNGDAVSVDKIEEAKSQILSILNYNHGKWDGVHEKFTIQEMGAILETIDKTTSILTAFVSAIAGIALIVAGIGVMNIMLVSVKERTREIGTRKALGAKPHEILNQFVMETLLLCGGGGLLGVGLASIAVFVISKISGWPAIITLSSIEISVILSMVTGLLFGLYPASRASEMVPVEALRYE